MCLLLAEAALLSLQSILSVLYGTISVLRVPLGLLANKLLHSSMLNAYYLFRTQSIICYLLLLLLIFILIFMLIIY